MATPETSSGKRRFGLWALGALLMLASASAWIGEGYRQWAGLQAELSIKRTALFEAYAARERLAASWVGAREQTLGPPLYAEVEDAVKRGHAQALFDRFDEVQDGINTILARELGQPPDPGRLRELRSLEEPLLRTRREYHEFAFKIARIRLMHGLFLLPSPPIFRAERLERELKKKSQ